MTDASFKDRFEAKIDKVIEDTGNTRVDIAEIRKDLNYHIKRTDLLEKKVNPLWTSYKVVGFLVGSSFFVAAVVEILGYFKK